MKAGKFTFILHTHLPYVLGHGRWPHGTDWLHEAGSECYVPILNVLNRLKAENVRPPLTIGLTPILCEQLTHPAFADQFDDYLQQKIDASRYDEEEFYRNGDSKAGLATMWKQYYTGIKADFDGWIERDIIGAYRKMMEAGMIEIITCAATHGYLPLLGSDEAVRAQVKGGVETHKKHFGVSPSGIWLPECAYRPAYEWTHPVDWEGKTTFMRAGLEEILYENGISYFIVDSHLLKGGKSIGAYIDRFEALKRLWGEFQKSYTQPEGPERTPRKAYLVSSTGGPKMAAILTRDAGTSLQVWSGEWGYPGDGQYLDFHKKHFPGGNRYWRVTSAKADLADKEEYNPGIVDSRIRENAGHFKDLVKSSLETYRKESGETGIMVAPFDTELFGHWWFEGPQFLYYACKWIHDDPDIEATTGGAMIQSDPPKDTIAIPEGSWGEGGYHFIWLNEWNEWTWKHIYESESRMVDLAERFAEADDALMQRLLTQMGRELWLLESSDWQFLISTWAARDYAEMRLSVHHNDFMKLAGIAETYGRSGDMNETDLHFLEETEARDSAFKPDPKWWRKDHEVNK